MPKRIRRVLADKYYSITVRVHGCRYWLKPEREVHDLVLTWLIRAVRKYGVEVVVVMFMSDHYHLIVRCPGMNLDLFMKYFQSKAALDLNRHWKEPCGSVFSRYVSLEIECDVSLVDTIVYFLTNPVSAGLVRDCRQWPGLSSARAMLDGERLTVRALDRTAWHRAKKPADKERFMQDLELELAVPDCWRHLQHEERRTILRQLVENRQRDLLLEHEREGRPVPADSDPRRFLRISHRDRPARPKMSRAPLCHAATREAREDFRLRWKAYVCRYREASARYRAGERDVEFPQGSYRPWLRSLESPETEEPDASSAGASRAGPRRSGDP